MAVRKIVITKAMALREYRSASELAEALDLTKGRISQLEDDDPLPQQHALLLKFVLKPEAFQHVEVSQ